MCRCSPKLGCAEREKNDSTGSKRRNDPSREKKKKFKIACARRQHETPKSLDGDGRPCGATLGSERGPEACQTPWHAWHLQSHQGPRLSLGTDTSSSREQGSWGAKGTYRIAPWPLGFVDMVPSEVLGTLPPGPYLLLLPQTGQVVPWASTPICARSLARLSCLCRIFRRQAALSSDVPLASLSLYHNIVRQLMCTTLPIDASLVISGRSPLAFPRPPAHRETPPPWSLSMLRVCDANSISYPSTHRSIPSEVYYNTVVLHQIGLFSYNLLVAALLGRSPKNFNLLAPQVSFQDHTTPWPGPLAIIPPPPLRRTKEQRTTAYPQPLTHERSCCYSAFPPVSHPSPPRYPAVLLDTCPRQNCLSLIAATLLTTSPPHKLC